MLQSHCLLFGAYVLCGSEKKKVFQKVLLHSTYCIDYRSIIYDHWLTSSKTTAVMTLKLLFLRSQSATVSSGQMDGPGCTLKVGQEKQEKVEWAYLVPTTAPSGKPAAVQHHGETRENTFSFSQSDKRCS